MFELKIAAASAAELRAKLEELLGQSVAVTHVTEVPLPQLAQPQPQPVASVAAVPVAAAPGYTHEQLMLAGSALVDAGKMPQLVQLLQSFGVQAVTQLAAEQLGAFATELRGLGAAI